jgi:hypothetical protein
MNGYPTPVPRVAFGIAALAMAAITFGVAIVMPAKLSSNRGESRLLATTPGPALVVTIGPGIDVVAVREAAASKVPCTSSGPKPKPEGLSKPIPLKLGSACRAAAKGAAPRLG